MTNFIWPSDQDRAENDELNRVCEYLEEVLAERDALAAHLERWHSVYVDLTNNMMMLDGLAHYVANNAMMRRFDEIDESAPASSLARLKAEWQADGAESFKAELLKSTQTYIHPHIEGVHAVWLRRQAEETSHGR